MDAISSLSRVAGAEGQTVDLSLRLNQLRKASTDFEAMLSQEMLQKMQDSLQGGGLVGTGVSGSVYSGMLTEAVSKTMAEKQSLGIAKKVFADVIQHDAKLKEYVDAHAISWENPKGKIDTAVTSAAQAQGGLPLPSQQIAPADPLLLQKTYPQADKAIEAK